MAQREVPADELFAAKLEAAAFVFNPHEHWWWHKRVLADGRVLYLFPMFEGNRLGVSRDAHDDGFEDIYDYPDMMASWRAALGWDGAGDPEGWVRHHRWGEGDCRRRPDGHAESEYRAP